MIASTRNQKNQELDVTTIGNAENIYDRYPLQDVLKSDMGFRLFMQQLSMYYTFPFLFDVQFCFFVRWFFSVFFFCQFCLLLVTDYFCFFLLWMY